MASYEDREAFIPYRRTDLIELCLEDGQLDAAEAQKFRDFCSLLSAYYHFQFHSYLERLKDNYTLFDPDANTKSRIKPTPQERASREATLIADLKTILERANYFPLSTASLQRALAQKSLIELKTSVDFNDFDQVALLIKFQNEAYFASKKAKPDKLKFTPGKMYLYLYKNIPKFDIEFLFPNVKTRMTWKDRLLLGIPAIGAAIPLILKVLPQLLLVIGLILFIAVGPSHLSHLEELRPSEEEMRNIMPVLVATFSLSTALGGFAFQQYSSYKSKQPKFQKNVTETLFFRNLASNSRVFHSLIDAAAEEECKEIILVCYHLITSKTPLNSEQLDNRIETWMDEKFGTKIDFDINGHLQNLEAIRGKIAKDG